MIASSAPLRTISTPFSFFCLGDWERVTTDGPWNFRGNAVILSPYDGITKPSKVALDTLDIWIQIHDVPDKYAHLVEALAGKVGKVLFTEPKHKILLATSTACGCRSTSSNRSKTRSR